MSEICEVAAVKPVVPTRVSTKLLVHGPPAAIWKPLPHVEEYRPEPSVAD
jgi:hypothetical protein